MPTNGLKFQDQHLVNAAEGWLELGVPTEAARELRLLSPAALVHFRVLDIRWRIHASSHQWDLALEVARLFISLVPNDPMGWIHQSYTLHELKQTSEALLLLEPLADRFPDTDLIPYNLACYACQLGDLLGAQSWLERAAKKNGFRPLKQMALEDPDLRPLWEFIKQF